MKATPRLRFEDAPRLVQAINTLTTDGAVAVVRAVNCHDDLVNALRECASAIEVEVQAGEMDHPIIRAHAKTAQRARAALAKVEA